MIRTEGDGKEYIIRQLFDDYYEKLCLYAEGIVRDHVVAEDIVEELFVYLWINCENLKITPAFGSYLFRSVHNNCIRYNQKNQSANHTQISGHEKEILESDAHHLPLSMVITAEIENKAEEILNNLPERCRQIFIMNRYENKNYSDISAELNISVSAIKTHMTRALTKMKEGLKFFFD